VSRNVVDRVSALAGKDANRKRGKGSKELTIADRQWLASAMTVRVRRVAEADAVRDVPALTMSDFGEICS
jgi:hypothetical protein